MGAPPPLDRNLRRPSATRFAPQAHTLELSARDLAGPLPTAGGPGAGGVGARPRTKTTTTPSAADGTATGRCSSTPGPLAASQQRKRAASSRLTPARRPRRRPARPPRRGPQAETPPRPRGRGRAGTNRVTNRDLQPDGVGGVSGLLSAAPTTPAGRRSRLGRGLGGRRGGGGGPWVTGARGRGGRGPCYGPARRGRPQAPTRKRSPPGRAWGMRGSAPWPRSRGPEGGRSPPEAETTVHLRRGRKRAPSLRRSGPPRGRGPAGDEGDGGPRPSACA